MSAPLLSGLRVQGFGFRVQGPGFRVQGPGFRVSGSGFRVLGSELRVEGLGSHGQDSHHLAVNSVHGDLATGLTSWLLIVYEETW